MIIEPEPSKLTVNGASPIEFDEDILTMGGTAGSVATTARLSVCVAPPASEMVSVTV